MAASGTGEVWVENNDDYEVKSKTQAAMDEAEEIINSNITDSNDDLIKIKTAYTRLETVINMKSHHDDVEQAILRLKSGKVILKAKRSCKYGAWEVFAVEHFSISTEERKIRQKAASIKNIDKYTILGWKRIKLLAQAINIYKFNDPIDKIFNSISYQLDLTIADDEDMFKMIVDAYIINEKLLKPNNIKIKLEAIVDAVECNIQFNDKLINNLSKKKNPAVALYNMIDYEAIEPKPKKEQLSRCRELVLILEKLTSISKEAIDKNYPLTSIELYLLEDGAHYIKELYKRKCKEEGLDWEEVYENLSVINNSIDSE